MERWGVVAPKILHVVEAEQYIPVINEKVLFRGMI